MSNNSPYYYCNIEGETNVGCKRIQNEDWLDSFECNNGLVAVVCDGMGGHVGGQVASHLAIDSIREFVCGNSFSDPNEMIVAACNVANQAIINRSISNPELKGMGSTCVMLVVRDGKVYVGSVGDSRVYLIRSKKIIQLTKDQSYVQMLVDMGEITPEQAEVHPRRNEITNALGLPGMRPATVLECPVVPEAGDCFLLCSDGLSGMVSNDGIAKIVSNQANMSQRERVSALIKKACDNGGNDNVTCQIVEFSVSPFAAKKKTGSLLWLWILLPLLTLTLAGAGVAVWYYWDTLNKPAKVESHVPTPSSVEPIINDLWSEFKFKVGTTVFKIKKNDDDVYELVYKLPTSKDTTILLTDVSDISSMKYNEKMFESEEKDGEIVYRFSKGYHGEKFAIRFDVDENTAYIYNFTVKNPPKQEVGETSNSSAPEISKKVEAPENGNEDTVVPKDNTITNLNRTDDTVHLEVTLSSDETTEFTIKYVGNRDDEDDVQQDGIAKASFLNKGSEQDCGWYKYIVNTGGNECTVTVYNSKLQEESALIEIPLEDNDKYVVRVVKSADSED